MNVTFLAEEHKNVLDMMYAHKRIMPGIFRGWKSQVK